MGVINIKLHKHSKGGVLVSKEKLWEEYVENMTWSFSRVNSFADGCKFCWFENYANKNRDSMPNAFADYGLLMHEILESLDKDEITIWEGIMKYDKEFCHISDFPKLGKADMRERYYKQGIDYLQKYSFDDNYEVLGVEDKIMVDVMGYKFTGYIDKIVRDKRDGGIIVIDHKSKAKFNSAKERHKYARQLYLYSIHIKDTYGQYPKMLMFNMFRSQKEVPIMFNIEDYKEAQQWVYDTIQEIKKCKEFPVSDDWFFTTHLCNFRQLPQHHKGYVATLDDWRCEPSNKVQ